MTRNQVCILSGAIRTGKTTALKNWVEQTPNVAGFLSPDINGKRMFKNIKTGELTPMETEQKDLVVGKYAFDYNSFKHVENEILKEWRKATANFIVLDEIGPLEIKKGLGFHKLLIYLQQKTNTDKPNLIFVVRDFCLETFLKKYDFKNIRVFNVKQLKSSLKGIKPMQDGE